VIKGGVYHASVAPYCGWLSPLGRCIQRPSEWQKENLKTSPRGTFFNFFFVFKETSVSISGLLSRISRGSRKAFLLKKKRLGNREMKKGGAVHEEGDNKKSGL
jgi:hypothetical protein